MCDYKYKLTCMRVASDSSQSFRVYCRMNQLKPFYWENIAIHENSDLS